MHDRWGETLDLKETSELGEVADIVPLQVDPNPRKNEPHVWLPPSWDPVVFTY